MGLLNAEYDSLDAVPEVLREEVTEVKKGDKSVWVPTVLAGLLENRNKVLTELAAFKAQSKKFEGIDPEKYKAYEAELQERQQADMLKKGEYDALSKQMQEKFEQERQTFNGKIEKYKSAMERNMVDAKVVAALAEKKGDATLLLPHIKQFVRVIEDGDDFAAVVVDEKGQRRIRDTAQNPFTIDDLVDEMAKSPVFGRAFDAPATAGGGAKNNPAQSTATLSGTVKITESQAKDTSAFRQAHDLAQKQNTTVEIIPG